MLALQRVSLSIPSWTFDSYWERTLEKELRNVATAMLCPERRVTEYFMRLTSGASCVNSSKIFHTQLLYTGYSTYHTVRRRYLPRLTLQLHYPVSVRKKTHNGYINHRNLILFSRISCNCFLSNPSRFIINCTSYAVYLEYWHRPKIN
jgi:hypothetical protein